MLSYGERADQAVLSLLQAPSDDLVSVSALAAAGAHLVLFSTGRGTPLGAPVPTVKVATQTSVFEYKNNWIDFGAGQLLSGKPQDELLQKLIREIMEIASGERQSLNERNGYREIAILKSGVTL